MLDQRRNDRPAFRKRHERRSHHNGRGSTNQPASTPTNTTVLSRLHFKGKGQRNNTNSIKETTTSESSSSTSSNPPPANEPVAMETAN